MIATMSVHFSSPASARAPVEGAHIWLLDLSQLNANTASKSAKYLSSSELQRANKFTKKRDEFIITRAFVRHCLSHYIHQASQDIQLESTKAGKPFIINTPIPIQFNLSHSHELATIAISQTETIGIDIETPRKHNFMDIAQRFYHQDEFTRLATASATEREALFFKLWTLKEAFFKALGGGISMGLEKINIDVNTDKIAVIFAAELAQDEQHWQFYQTQIRENFYCSLATKSNTPIAIQWLDGNILFK